MEINPLEIYESASVDDDQALKDAGFFLAPCGDQYYHPLHYRPIGALESIDPNDHVWFFEQDYRILSPEAHAWQNSW